MAYQCKDTKPAYDNDPSYPYVGKVRKFCMCGRDFKADPNVKQYIANLTLAQIKTLDCGSLRQAGYPFQLLYPGIKLATLPEFFVRIASVDCSDC